MNKLLLLTSIIFITNCFSQSPNPDLYQTWYLRFIQSHDLDEPYIVSEIDPSISPTLTISNTLNYDGTASCNTFTGNFANLNDNLFEFSQFSSSTIDCITPIHISFENSYFGFLQSAGWYQITPEGTGLILTMDNQIFGRAIFQNFTLKNKDFDIDSISFYPNPTDSTLFFNYNELAISKIQVYNSLGQNIKTISNDFEVVDISNLPFGIYIFKFDTEFGSINKKIIKN